MGCVQGEAPLAASDYLALSEHYAVLGIEGVPELTTAHHNAARRLITLIDVWYDRGLELHLSSPAARLEDLFTGLHAELPDDDAIGAPPAAAPPAAAAADHHSVSMRGEGGASARLSSTWIGDSTEWSATGRLGVSLSALSGLQDAAFAQRRAVSRLREMGCAQTWPPEPPWGGQV